MIDIRIDDEACTGCTLCVDTCPTGVFRFDEVSRRPAVEKRDECFGCLSCSEICPAAAIRHAGAASAWSFHHDPQALAMARQIAGEDWTPPATLSGQAGLGRALQDLGVRLLSVAAVFRQTLGASMPAVGTMAGRTLASHLPRFREPGNLDEALSLTRQIFAPAWDLTFIQHPEQQVEVQAGACFVRSLCGNENLPLGGDLCTLFYNYLAGYLSKVTGRRPKLAGADRASTGCRYRIELH